MAGRESRLDKRHIEWKQVTGQVGFFLSGSSFGLFEIHVNRFVISVNDQVPNYVLDVRS